MHTINYSRSIPVRRHYDVLVVGAGPAGLCAAVSAARAGASVGLIERYGVVGGNLTTGHVGPILGMVGRGTMRDEITALLGVPENDMSGVTGVAHDFEHAKIALTQLLEREGVETFLQCAVFDVVKDNSRVRGVILSTKEGPAAFTGEVVIDCTGDGDVAFLSGAICDKGREDGLMQPVTLEFTIENVDESRAIVCIGDIDDVELNGERFLDYCKRCAEHGELPTHLAAVRLHRTIHPGERQVNTSQANGIDSTRIDDLFRAEADLRRQIDLLIRFLRTHLPGYEHCRLKSSGTTLGVRESRRVRGEYVITAEDLASGRRFDDVVVHKAEFFVDIHNPTGPGQAEKQIQHVIPYDLPYRCFVPIGIEGLFVAGRCISGTHRAHASYRIMSVCMAMGEAIGLAAALCAQNRVAPRGLNVRLLQDELTARGIDLFSE